MKPLNPAILRATLRVTLVFLALSTWGIVWQAQVIQQQKHLIRQLSGLERGQVTSYPQ